MPTDTRNTTTYRPSATTPMASTAPLERLRPMEGIKDKAVAFRPRENVTDPGRTGTAVNKATTSASLNDYTHNTLLVGLIAHLSNYILKKLL